MATSGQTLRRRRRIADVSTVALAARIGISRQSLWVLERSAVVDDIRARQYRSALQALIDERDATEASGDVA